MEAKIVFVHVRRRLHARISKDPYFKSAVDLCCFALWLCGYGKDGLVTAYDNCLCDASFVAPVELMKIFAGSCKISSIVQIP